MKHLLLYEFFSFKSKNDTEVQKEIKRPVLKRKYLINKEIEKLENNLKIQSNYISLYMNSLGDKKNYYAFKIYDTVLDIFKSVYKLSKVDNIKDKYPKIMEVLNSTIDIEYTTNKKDTIDIFSDICFYINESYKKLNNVNFDVLELVSTGINTAKIRNKKKAEEKRKGKKDIDPLGEEDWAD